MSCGPPPPKKPRGALQQAGQFVKSVFHIPPSQPLPPNPGPSSGSSQNQTPGSATQPAQISGALQPGTSSTAPHRGIQRAARVAWSRLENALQTLQQSSDMFPPVKPAVNGLLACIDILEASARPPYTAASQGREEYDELASNLAIILSDLAKHLRESRSIQMSNCVTNIISGIEQQIDAINIKKARLGPRRLLEAQQDIDDLIGCYRRIEMLFRQLQNNAVLSVWSMAHEQLANTRLDSMRPAMDAHYDSAMAAVVLRRQCTPNTRQAVLEGLRAWKNDPNGAKVYWMNGMAGTGKTTIASTFCFELEGSRQLAGSFFCSRELPDCREAKRVIPTISYQIARFLLPFQSALCEALANDPDASRRSVGVQFQKLIKEPLLRVKRAIPEGVIVVIDALDECSDSANVRSFLDVLHQSAGDLPIRFFVTCRPDPSLSKKLQSWSEASRTLFHLHDIEQAIVRGDIEIYLGVELKGLPTDRIRRLSQQAGNLFIFAATVVRYVKPDGENDIWYDRLEMMLSAQWSPGSKAYISIDALYSTILSAAFSRPELELVDVETMKQVLHTVVCAKEPMTIGTLAGVLGVTVNRLLRVVDPLRSVLHVSEGSQLVSTLHASFPDYMLTHGRSKEFFCNTGMHHRFLSLRCFDVMKQSLRFNICDLESSYLLDADVPNLSARVDNAVSLHLFYACSHWGDHLCEAGAEDALAAPVHDFLSNSVLFWLEVLSLRKCIGVGISMLANVRKWLQGRTVPDTVCMIAQDAYKFATLVATCHSTPHIYVSVLALWSREDPMWTCYGRRLQGLEHLERVLHSKKTSALRPLLANWENGDYVWSIAVSLDGSRIVSNYKDRFIVRDAYTGNQILSTTTGHTSSVTAVAISPNGHTIASGARDGTIYVWDAETGDIIAGPLEAHTKCVRSVAFSSDSARIAPGSEDCTIRIWDTQTGRESLSPLQGHTGTVFSVAFSPDGGRIASGSSDCTIRIWDVQTGHMLMKPFKRHTREVCSIGFLPDGARIASGSFDCTVRIWDAENGNMLSSDLVHEYSSVWSVAFSLDGTRVVSGSFDGTISILDAHSGDILAGPFEAHTDAIRSVVFSPDGQRLISGSDDETIRIWDVNAATLCVNQSDPEPPSVVAAAFSLDHDRIISVFSSGTVRIWDMRAGDLLADLMPYTYVSSAAFSPDGARTALGFSKGHIQVCDVENGNVLLDSLRGHAGAVFSLAFSPNGKCLASGSDDGIILLWDIHTGNILTDPLGGHAGVVHSMAFSPDGGRIASGAHDTICIWDTQTGDVLLGPLKGHSGAVCSVGLSPDGRHLVSGSRDGTIRVWDAQTGNMLAHPFVGHTSGVNSVAFSPDSSRIVSGSDDGTIRIWNAQTGETLAGPFEAHAECVNPVAFSPDGSRIVSGSDDGRIFIWELGDSDYDVNNVAGTWSLDHDGWIVGRNSARLLWLPPALRAPPPGKPFVIHDRGPFGIDFDTAPVGTRWLTCFSG